MYNIYNMHIISIIHSYFVISHAQVAPTSCGSTGTGGNSASQASFSHFFGDGDGQLWWKLIFSLKKKDLMFFLVFFFQRDFI